MRKLLALLLAFCVPAIAFAQTTVPPKCVPGTSTGNFRFNRFGFGNQFLLNRLLLGNGLIGNNFIGNGFGFNGLGYGGGFGQQVVFVPQFTGYVGGGCASQAAFIPQASGCCGQQIVAPQFQQFAAPPVISSPCASAGLGFNAGFGGYGVGAPLLGGSCGVNPAFVGAGFNGLGGFGGYGGFGGGGLLSNGFIPNLLSGILGNGFGGFGRGFGFHRFHR